eukprot:11180178-Lingulodinium_polyedra.AAC.1
MLPETLFIPRLLLPLANGPSSRANHCPLLALERGAAISNLSLRGSSNHPPMLRSNPAHNNGRTHSNALAPARHPELNATGPQMATATRLGLPSPTTTWGGLGKRSATEELPKTTQCRRGATDRPQTSTGAKTHARPQQRRAKTAIPMETRARAPGNQRPGGNAPANPGGQTA